MKKFLVSVLGEDRHFIIEARTYQVTDDNVHFYGSETLVAEGVAFIARQPGLFVVQLAHYSEA